jgi:hypothetical protein
MKSRLHREVAELEKRRGVVKCKECHGVEYIGLPGLSVSMWIPDGTGPGTHRKATMEEFEAYFYGCPTCGEPVKTIPILLPGLKSKSRGDGSVVESEPEVPDPWPIAEWPRTPVAHP